MKFEPVRTQKQREKLAEVAHSIWHEYWPSLMGLEQTEYMIEQFQSFEALTRDINENGYEYWLIKSDGMIVGYTGVKVEQETNRLFISKIYLYDHARGKGYARKTFEFLEELCRERGLSSMYLTVFKGNSLAIKAYKSLGLKVTQSVETDIGKGFIMDDYILEKSIS